MSMLIKSVFFLVITLINFDKRKKDFIEDKLTLSVDDFYKIKIKKKMMSNSEASEFHLN